MQEIKAPRKSCRSKSWETRMSSIRRSRRIGFAFALKSIFVLAALGSLAACGASSSAETSGSSTEATSTTPSTSPTGSTATPAVVAPPLVSLKASQTTVAMGAPVTLQWAASNANSCAASGGWSGTLPPAGSTTTPPLSAQTAYTLTCSGSGGTTTQSGAVSVAAAAPVAAATPAPPSAPLTPAPPVAAATAATPSVTLSASPTTIGSGGRATLTWKSANATACVAIVGSWRGDVPTSAVWQTPVLPSTTEYEVTCTGAGGSATQSATVTVSSKAPIVTLSATPSSVKSGASSTLTWSSSDATACTASGGWSGSKGLSGSQPTAAVS